MVSFGPRRRVVPNQNRGHAQIAQRRIAEAAGRAAEKTRTSVSVDAWPTLVHLRNPRGTMPCPCSDHGGSGTHASSGGTVELDLGRGDDLGSVDGGYPLPRSDDLHAPGELLSVQGDLTQDVGLAVQRMMMGSGRRCGICWGSGWLDGYQLWGGNRRIMCVSDAPGVVALDDDCDVEVDVGDTTPTMVGPGSVSWSVRINEHDVWLEALRVRDGLLPSAGGYDLTVSANGIDFDAPALVLSGMRTSGDSVVRIVPGTYVFRLHLQQGARVSHVEITSRSECRVNLQLPQLQQAASAELIAPMLVEDFEIDPVVGNVERGTVLDVRPRNGMVGGVWLVTDVTVRRTAVGQIWGITGSVRSVQPTDVLASASLSDDLRSGIMDRGRATRGLEATGMGAPTGVGGTVDNGAAAVRRGSPHREDGHVAGTHTITLANGEWD